MILFPPAKINLGLNVHSKREDGFHEISTCMLTIPVYDILEVLPDEKLHWIQTGIEIPGDNNQNLCVKAFELIQKHHNIPGAYIHLNKQIPMGAGLGGGSSDATYVLLALNEVYQLNLSRTTMEEYAASLGSDCPYFINDNAKIATGRGEVLEDIDFSLKGYFLKLVNPGIHIGTAEAYANVHFSDKIDLEKLLLGEINEWKGALTNDFEVSIFDNHPEIKMLKESLYSEGAVYAAMSGSGSSVYGIYKTEPKSHPEFYTKVVRLN